ncbi:MAG: AI-2E family transporter [Phormidium sp. GEM2.Bin31]|nr:AI-2E family transporter [Phormidium sp. BM_Day4_Bin.17]TVR05042.1 MAG: AI-2E family transporter [Phormidium sp. GEM2.Bin31]UCJ13557.1 MAG: AI-2E family transporter [Phormidium sp. PBR-2020]
MTKRLISLSLPNIIVIAAVVLALFVLWQLQSLMLILMISVVLAASLAPVVDFSEKMLRLPRWLATILTYVSLISVLTSVVLIIGPPVFEQIERLVRQLPKLSEEVLSAVELAIMHVTDARPELVLELFDTQSITRWVIGSSQQLVLRSYSITRGILGAAFSLILALFISGYMVADSRKLVRSVVQLFPQPWEDRLADQSKVVGQRMGGYIRGRVLVSIILAVATSTVLTILGLKDFALGLGAIAGVTNLIPFVGPILGAIPALIVAIAQGGWLVLWVLLLFVVIQNLETYVLDPLLVGNSVGVHPLFQLLSVLGGAQVLGIIGALIVPPWFAGASALVENLYLRPKRIAEAQNESAAIAVSAAPVPSQRS